VYECPVSAYVMSRSWCCDSHLLISNLVLEFIYQNVFFIEQVGIGAEKSEFILPFWFAYLGWVFAVCALTVAAFFIILYR